MEPVRIEDAHARPAAEVLDALAVPESGLDETEAAERLRVYGANALPREPAPPWWLIGLRQFRNPLIYVLAAAAVLSVGIGEYSDAGFIGAVLLINALIGGYQEWRADRSTRALQALLQIRASVVRGGEVREISAEGVVPGDLVWLESGNRVPADARLVSAHGLEIDESFLTGESLSVLKDADWRGAEEVPLADRKSMAYAGSIVVRGRAKAAVVATGARTAVGQLAVDVMRARGAAPPLLVRLERFTRVVAVAVLAAAALVAATGVLVQGLGVGEMFLFAVALAVSAIPEGLPVSITVALAIATSRMARRGVIVRQLAAVEGLGSCTLIASDKTGTLTCNELTVRELRLADGSVLEATGQGFAPEGSVVREGQPADLDADPDLRALVEVAVLCNEADLHHRDSQWTWRGDPTDIALLSVGRKLGIEQARLLDRCPQVNEIPFEPEYQFAATYHRTEAGTRVFVKGAPERVFAMSADASDQAALERLRATTVDMARRGFRVLALASGPAPEGLDSAEAPPPPTGLRIHGFVGMIDPLRPGVRDAVERCHDAGVDVAMVTGDHPVTALAISRELGLARDDSQVVTGAQLSGLDGGALDETVRRARVFARTAPHQKLQIVQSAQRTGHFVAVTGDGVNDAPALRAANIGVAMGKGGTDVAREAAELVLSDDNFSTIVAGVEEGRVAYDNVRKVTYLLISTGAAEVVLVLLAVAFGLPLPLLPVQLLWLNLVTNGIQDKALAFEKGEGDVLRRRPRPPTERIFNRIMIERTLVGAIVMGVVGFFAFRWMLAEGWELDAARNALLLLMVLFENIHIGNCRSETKSAFMTSPLRSPLLLVGAGAAFSLHVLMMHVPFGQALLRVEPVSGEVWALMLGLALTIFVALELHKLSWYLRRGRAAKVGDVAG